MRLFTIVTCLNFLLLLLDRSYQQEQTFEDIAKKDLYQILDVDKKSSQHDIRQSYRKLAQIYHPDKSNPSDKEFHEEKFKEIAEAYEILVNNKTRREYDNSRTRYLNKHQRSKQPSQRSHHRNSQNQYQTNKDKFQMPTYHDNKFADPEFKSILPQARKSRIASFKVRILH